MENFIEICAKVLPVILGSAVIAAIVKIVDNVINNRYIKRVDYASDNVKEANRKIKKLSILIKKCSYLSLQDGSLDNYLYELKSYLDVSGHTRKYDYNSDGHAWKDIDRLCKSKNEGEFIANKEMLLMDMILLQQFREDNIKKDIQGKRANVFLLLFSSVVIGLYALCYFVAFELSDFMLYVFGVLILLSTILYLPGFLFGSAFEAGYYSKHARKKEDFRKVTKRKNTDIVLAVVYSVILVILGICWVYLLQLYVMKQDTVGTVSDAVVSQDFWENVIQSLREERIFIFWSFACVYVFLGLFNILLIWLQKFNKSLYAETVRRLRIEKNGFYVHEIKELIDKAKKQMLEDEIIGYTLICDKMLVLAYVKLSDLKEYFKTEKGNRISSIESYEDVEREMKFCENEDKIDEAIELFKEIRKIKISLKKIKKKVEKNKLSKSFVNKTKEKSRLISEKLDEVNKKLSEINFNFN